MSDETTYFARKAREAGPDYLTMTSFLGSCPPSLVEANRVEEFVMLEEEQ